MQYFTLARIASESKSPSISDVPQQFFFFFFFILLSIIRLMAGGDRMASFSKTGIINRIRKVTADYTNSEEGKSLGSDQTWREI